MENEIYKILKKHKLPLKKREEVLTDLLLLFSVVGQSEQLKCDCCNGTGMVEGDCIDELESCLTCNGKGTF